MSADQTVPETADDQLGTLQSEVERRFSELKSVLNALQKNVISQPQFTSMTNSIGERFDLLKKEVDALQVEVMKPARPWYREASALISIIAVVFSFGTAAASYLQIGAQDKRAARNELRQLIQRMITIPKENMELIKTYEKDATTSNLLSGLINQENTVIARQSAEILEQIPDDVSASEYYCVAFALLNSNTPEKVPLLIERGLSVAKDYSAELELLRLYGNVLMLLGDINKGRAKYQEALDLFNKYHLPNTPYVATSNAITEMNWASSEFGQGQCKEVEKLLNQSRDTISKIPANPLTERLKQQVDNYEEVFQKNKQNCKN